MFTKSARFYDAIYSFKDYAKECGQIVELAGSHAGGTLLDVACGTGKHLEILRNTFQCEGLDLDANLLAIARERLPDTPLHHADMTSFDLGRRFDVVTCLFSAIGYAETVERLNSTVRRFAAHLKPGGVVLFDPWLSPEVWNPEHLHALFVDEPDLKIARMSAPRTEGNVSVVGFEYLVSTRDGIERSSEFHRLGLFTGDDYMAAITGAGLSAEFVEGGLMGRGLYIGRGDQFTLTHS